MTFSCTLKVGMGFPDKGGVKFGGERKHRASDIALKTNIRKEKKLGVGGQFSRRPHD